MSTHAVLCCCCSQLSLRLICFELGFPPRSQQPWAVFNCKIEENSSNARFYQTAAAKEKWPITLLRVFVTNTMFVYFSLTCSWPLIDVTQDGNIQCTAGCDGWPLPHILQTGSVPGLSQWIKSGTGCENKIMVDNILKGYVNLKNWKFCRYLLTLVQTGEVLLSTIHIWWSTAKQSFSALSHK